MANETQSKAAMPAGNGVSKAIDSEERENWFIRTPNPWTEIVTLEHGGDRTFASTIEQMVLNAAPSERVSLEKSLLTALTASQLRSAGRLFICRMLGLIGTAASIPTLARLLSENETADVARMALDQIDDPHVSDAYRSALGKLSGAAKAGLIGSMAMRKDRGTLDLLRTIARDPAEPADVRASATRAVERLTAKA